MESQPQNHEFRIIPVHYRQAYGWRHLFTNTISTSECIPRFTSKSFALTKGQDALVEK